MTPRPVLVKLGGSVLTDKSQLRTLREDALPRLAGELADVRGPVVLVHGAGSYGHVRASKHQVHEGTSGAATPMDASRVRTDVLDLHRHVLAALQDAGLAPSGVPGAALTRLRNGEATTVHVTPVTDALRGGFTPVTHGDVAADTTRAFGIVSGDVLMEALARELRPRLAVFVTDVDGVLDPHGDTIPHLSPTAALDPTAAGGSGHPDVTGGMAGKLKHMARMAQDGTPVRVVDGTQPGRVLGATTGHPLTGTLICEGGTPS